MKRLIQTIIVTAAGCMALCTGCKKTFTVQPIISSTPLQALINSDTTLSLFYSIVKKSSDSTLYAGLDSVTILIPTNTAFARQGFTIASVNGLSAAAADSILRYHYLADSVILLPGSYSAYPSKLGPAVYGYGNPDSTGNYFNGNLATYQKLPGSNATVYELSGPLHVPAASITQLIASDTVLTFFAEALRRTNINPAPNNGWNTLLAPVNSAFMAAGYPDLASIDNADPATLTNIIQYHIIPGQYFSNSFRGLTAIATLKGANISISFSNGATQFTGTGNMSAAGITTADRIAAGSVILHNVNAVLIP